MTSEQELLEQQKQQCIMCKIVSGEIASRKVYEDDLVLAVLDIRPATKGHVIVIPKEHYQILPIIPPEVFTRMFEVAGKVQLAQMQGIPMQGSTTFVSVGFNFNGGQTFPHVMIHLIPRDKGDGLSNFDLSVSELLEHQLEEIEKPITANLKAAMSNYLAKIGKAERKITSEEVLRILEQNPDLKKIMLEQPDQFEKIIAGNPQLQEIFGAVDLDEIKREISGQPSRQSEDQRPSAQNSSEDKEDDVDLDELFGSDSSQNMMVDEDNQDETGADDSDEEQDDDDEADDDEESDGADEEPNDDEDKDDADGETDNDDEADDDEDVDEAKEIGDSDEETDEDQVDDDESDQDETGADDSDEDQENGAFNELEEEYDKSQEEEDEDVDLDDISNLFK